MTDWVVVRRNVNVCKECGNMMSLWKNVRSNQYQVICEWCPESFVPENVEEEKKETFEVPDYDNFMLYGNKFVFSNKRGTRKFYLWTAGNVHLAEVIDNGYCFKPVKEFINEPKSKESYEKARKICYDLYLDKEAQDD